MIELEYFDPASGYVRSSDEWRALRTLAALEAPAQAVRFGGWRREHFFSAGAAAAFARVAAAADPLRIDPPADVGQVEVVPESSLPELRERLTWLAMLRQSATLHYQFAQQLRKISQGVAHGEFDNPTTLLEALGLGVEQARRLGQETGAAYATPADLAASYKDRIAQQAAAIPTGIGALDLLLGGGFEPGRLMLLLAGPGSGKTTFANQLADHVANSGRAVCYLTLEETPATLFAKTVARIGNLDYTAVRRGYATEMPRILGAVAEAGRRPGASRLLYISDLASLPELRAVVQAHFKRWGSGPGLLVVDYLQQWARMQRENAGGARELREIVTLQTERLRELARELQCTVLAISSQNRASGYGNGSAALMSAKESGDIEYSCDVLAALGDDDGKETRRPVASGHTLKYLALLKNRQGDTGGVVLDWYASRQQFSMLARSYS